MPHPLEQRIDAVSRRANRLLGLHALCWVAAVTIGVAMLMGLSDWLLRTQQPAVRWLASTIVLAALLWAAVRWLWPALRIRFNRLATARRIEQRFPKLKDRLSSAVAFAAEPERDPRAGSLELRRAVISETESLATDVDFTQALDRRPFRRAAWLFAMALGALTLVAVLFPTSSSLAARRLLMPWSDARWPLRHSLAFVKAPTRLAAGDDFELQVVDRTGRLPESVELLLRIQGESGRGTETHAMKLLADRMVYRLENVTRPFAYRAVGGDDRSMPWTEVDVVEPPRIVELTLNIRPPAYTALPDEQVERIARVIAGSALAAEGKLDKPARSVKLRAESGPLPTLSAALAADGLSFVIPGKSSQPWLATKSGVYWFEVEDEQGVSGGREMRIDLQVVADSAPAIAWETPTDHTFVTPRALLPFKALVKDDLAVQRVALKYLQPDATDENERELELFLAKPAPLAANSNRTPRPATVQTVTIDTVFDLAQLPGLQPGNILAVRLVAEDYRPQSATTPVRRITVLNEAEFETRLLQQQTSVFTQLAEVLRLEREAHSQIAALSLQLEETKRLQPRDIDQLQGAELMQRQVQRLLDDPKDGVEMRLSGLLTELDNNRIENAGIARRMTMLRDEVRRINLELMPAIAQPLTAALKSARGGATPDAASSNVLAGDWSSVASALDEAESKQQQAVDALESLLAELAEWDNFSRLAREIGQIRQQQEGLQQETETLRWKVAGAPAEQPTPEQRANSRQLALRQQDLARRFDKIQGRMDELLTRLETADPQAAGTLAEANRLGRQLAIGGQMRQAGRELNEFQAGDAERTQKTILGALAQLLDAFSSRRDRELQRTVQSLREAATEFNLLHQRQKQLQSLGEQAASEKDEEEQRRKLQRLSKQQQELAKELQQFSRKLERLQARRPAKSAEEGAASMAQAGAAADAGNAEQAQQLGEDAARLLEETRQQLQQEVQQAQEDLLREQLAQLEQSIAALAHRQKNVAAEIQRLEAARDSNAQLPIAQQATLANLAAEQQLLAEEAGQLRAKMIETPAFALALEGAQREMQRAADYLGRGRTDGPTSQAAEAARKRLEQVLAALKQDDSAAEPPMAPEDGGGEAGAPPEVSVQSLAELRLLADLQAEINRRTAEIETARGASGESTDEQAQDLAALAMEQGKLADMVFDLASKAGQGADEVPDLLQPEGSAEPKPKDPSPAKEPSLDEQLLRDLMETP